MRAPFSTMDNGSACDMCVLKEFGESNGSLRLQVIFTPINPNNLLRSREACVCEFGILHADREQMVFCIHMSQYIFKLKFKETSAMS